MTKDVGILVLGLLVAAMPFLGFPSSMEQIVFVVSGLVIAVLAFFIRGELGTGEKETESYVQNGGQKVSTDGIVERGESSHGEKERQEE